MCPCVTGRQTDGGAQHHYLQRFEIRTQSRHEQKHTADVVLQNHEVGISDSVHSLRKKERKHSVETHRSNFTDAVLQIQSVKVPFENIMTLCYAQSLPAPQKKPALTLPLEDREQGLDAVLQVDHHVYIPDMAQTKDKEPYLSRSCRKMALATGGC